jgi:ubiquinone/menaquinone biosynthesis C-methylase UbiE
MDTQTDADARALLERARPIGPSDRILDLGGGDGLVTRLLRERLGAAASIAETRAAALRFPDGSFELVFCHQMPPGGRAALAEVHRLLAPAGRFIASTLPPADGTMLQAELLRIGFADVRADAAGVVTARKR